MTPIIAFDTETALIQPGLLAPPLVCVSFAMRPEEPWLLEKDRGATAVEYALDREEILVGHNVAYDFAVLCAYRPHLIPKVFRHYEKGLVRDTKIRSQLIDIAAGCLNFPRADGSKGYSLADLELHYLGLDRSAEKLDPEGWRMRYAELEDVPLKDWPEAAKKYAMEDASGTLRVFAAQDPDAGDEYGRPLTNEIEQTQAAWALHLMNAWGLRTDGKAVTELEAKLLEAQVKNRRWLHRAALYKTRRATKEEVAAGDVDEWQETKKGPRPLRYARDMARIQSLVEKHYQRRNRPVPMTNTGRVATDKDTLTRAGSRLLQLVSDGGGVDKILQTYVPALKHGIEYPITSRANVLVESGRTSWSGMTMELADGSKLKSGLNIQNLPTGRRVGGVRDCFVPRPGYWYVSCDYSTLELRALAQVCLWLFGESRMADAIRAGKDLHLDFAAQLLNITYETALEWKAGTPEQRKKIKQNRDAAKIMNFGAPGGLGAATLVDYARVGYGVVLTFEESALLKARWLATWPEMGEYFKHAAALVGDGEAQITQFVSERKRGGVGYTATCNSYFQGLAADGAKAACFQTAYECYVDRGTALFGSRPVAFVHDELILEVPTDIAHEASMRLRDVMCEQMARYIPDIPIEAEPALMTRWLKAAEPKYEAGRLVPWDLTTAIE